MAASSKRSTKKTRGLFSLRSIMDGSGLGVRKNILEEAFFDVCTVDLNKNELCRAVGLCSLRLIRTLVEGGFDINSRNDDDQTALIVLTIKCPRVDNVTPLEIMSYLLNHGADPNLQDRYGKTALMYATALQQDAKLVSCLLEAGSNVFLEDNIGFTSLIYTYSTGNEQMIKMMSEFCQKQGREMVLIETKLSTNFLSYLKIQKLVGASRSTVAMPGTSTPTMKKSRRLSGQVGGKIANFLNVGSSSASQRRRASSISSQMFRDVRRRSRSVGQVATIDLRRKRADSPAPRMRQTGLTTSGSQPFSTDELCTDLNRLNCCSTCGKSLEKSSKDIEIQCNLVPITPKEETSSPRIKLEEF